jgi:hypothetical protein
MSKRFGRNQKRAMRAELQNASDKIVDLGCSVRYLESKVSEHEGLVDAILDILPRHFCAVAAEYAEMPETREYLELVPKLPKNFWELSNYPRQESTAVTRYALDILRLHIDEGRDPLGFEKMQHVLLNWQGKTWGIAITREALQHMPVEELGRDIAAIFKQRLKGN